MGPIRPMEPGTRSRPPFGARSRRGRLAAFGEFTQEPPRRLQLFGRARIEPGLAAGEFFGLCLLSRLGTQALQFELLAEDFLLLKLEGFPLAGNLLALLFQLVAILPFGLGVTVHGAETVLHLIEVRLAPTSAEFSIPSQDRNW